MTIVHPSSSVNPHKTNLLSIARQAFTISAFSTLYLPRALARHHASLLFKFYLMIEQWYSAQKQDSQVRMFPVPFVRKLARSTL